MKPAKDSPISKFKAAEEARDEAQRAVRTGYKGQFHIEPSTRQTASIDLLVGGGNDPTVVTIDIELARWLTGQFIRIFGLDDTTKKYRDALTAIAFQEQLDAPQLAKEVLGDQDFAL